MSYTPRTPKNDPNVVTQPFRSEAQRGYLYANDPGVAKEFEKHTPKGEKLPEHVKKAKSK